MFLSNKSINVNHTENFVIMHVAASCFVGYYYNTRTESCMECPKGFYQENLGQSYCHPCPVNQDTYGTGAKNRTNCIGEF